MDDNNVTYYISANWAYVNGNFSPEELREIAQEIEDKHSEFKETQANGFKPSQKQDSSFAVEG